MLISLGLDFNFHMTYGINSQVLAQHMIQIGLLSDNTKVRRVTFHGFFDFGYPIKAITRVALPESLANFKILVDPCFGRHVHDVKYMLGFNPHLFGGLKHIAAKIGVRRVLSVGHLAGSGSLLTQMVFQKLKTDYFKDEKQFKKNPGNICLSLNSKTTWTIHFLHFLSSALVLASTFKFQYEIQVFFFFFTLTVVQIRFTKLVDVII